MSVEDRRELLSLLGFEAVVAESGDVKASIAGPVPDEGNHHWTNIGMFIPGRERSGDVGSVSLGRARPLERLAEGAARLAL